MKHTVCDTDIVMRRQPIGRLDLMVPFCPTCGHDVIDDELDESDWRLS